MSEMHTNTGRISIHDVEIQLRPIELTDYEQKLRDSLVEESNGTNTAKVDITRMLEVLSSTEECAYNDNDARIFKSLLGCLDIASQPTDELGVPILDREDYQSATEAEFDAETVEFLINTLKRVSINIAHKPETLGIPLSRRGPQRDPAYSSIPLGSSAERQPPQGLLGMALELLQSIVSKLEANHDKPSWQERAQANSKPTELGA